MGLRSFEAAWMEVEGDTGPLNLDGGVYPSGGLRLVTLWSHSEVYGATYPKT